MLWYVYDHYDGTESHGDSVSPKESALNSFDDAVLDGPFHSREEASEEQMHWCHVYADRGDETTHISHRPEYKTVEDPTGHYTVDYIHADERVFIEEYEHKYCVGVYDEEYRTVGDCLTTKSYSEAIAEFVRRAVDCWS